MGERRVVAGVARTEQGLVVWSQRQARPIGIFPDESASTLPASRRLQPLLINLTLRARPAAATAPGETPPPGAAKTE